MILPNDIKAKAQRLWDSDRLLRAWRGVEDLFPWSLPLGCPRGGRLLEEFAAVRLTEARIARLEWGSVRSRSFRFVVIDEAFGRGSDESTRYALELFKKLNLQLLIVTPLQKIHVIEDYINAVHFVQVTLSGAKP